MTCAHRSISSNYRWYMCKDDREAIFGVGGISTCRAIKAIGKHGCLRPERIVDAGQPTLEAILVDRAQPLAVEPQHLCMDIYRDSPSFGSSAATSAGYRAHGRRTREEKLDALAASGVRHVCGSSSGRWRGCQSVVRCWSGKARRRRTTSDCSNSLALCPGSATDSETLI